MCITTIVLLKSVTDFIYDDLKLNCSISSFY
nr:MAG TPA: hypothetical protein [Caudoviricetes sp.]